MGRGRAVDDRLMASPTDSGRLTVGGETWLTLAEAARRWRLSSPTLIRNGALRGRFPAGSCRKLGRAWVITPAGMAAVWGPEPDREEGSR